MLCSMLVGVGSQQVCLSLEKRTLSAAAGEEGTHKDAQRAKGRIEIERARGTRHRRRKIADKLIKNRLLTCVVVGSGQSLREAVGGHDILCAVAAPFFFFSS